uniref:proton-conducting transporter transmembrane domain-containing protein n=1 Tax=Alistipes sp. TaxID=1872444 RepID=UPI0040568DDF
MLIETLVALLVLSVVIFLCPLRWKSRLSLSVVLLGTLWPLYKGVSVLLNPNLGGLLWQSESLIFGFERGLIDPLSALFLVVISLGGIATSIYAVGYLKPYEGKKSSAHLSLHYLSLIVLIFSMMGVVLTDGGYTFLFFWELMTIASFILILFDAERQAVMKAALSYLVMMHIGFLLLVGGFVSLWMRGGEASFTALSSAYSIGKALPLFLLFLAGFGMKAGLFPMHVWLPEAHPAAPSHVSAIMSGVMIKTGIYGILRITAALPHDALPTAGMILLGLGIITGLWGVILAATQNDMKRLMAYSSIENIGIILIGCGIATLASAHGDEMVALCALAGALLHTLNHSFFKSMIFFGAGNVYSKTHTTSLDQLGGVAKSMPMTGWLFLIATAAICALPPLNGFVSEWLIYVGLLENVAQSQSVIPSIIALVALALIGGIVLLAFTKLYGMVFLGSPRSHAVAEADEVDNFRIVGMTLPLIGILGVGLFPQWAYQAVVGVCAHLFEGINPAATPLPESLKMISLTAWILIGIALTIGLTKWLLQRRRKIEEGPTWGCGFTAPNIRMQYTGESYAEGLESIASSMAQYTGGGEAVSPEEIFPSSHSFEAGHKDKVESLLAQWWVEMLRRINGYVMRLRTGKINHYILFALAFLVLVFLLSLLNWI